MLEAAKPMGNSKQKAAIQPLEVYNVNREWVGKLGGTNEAKVDAGRGR
jgi:hypothetical protein